MPGLTPFSYAAGAMPVIQDENRWNRWQHRALALEHLLAFETPYGADYSDSMLGKQSRASAFWRTYGGNPIVRRKRKGGGVGGVRPRAPARTHGDGKIRLPSAGADAHSARFSGTETVLTRSSRLPFRLSCVSFSLHHADGSSVIGPMSTWSACSFSPRRSCCLWIGIWGATSSIRKRVDQPHSGCTSFGYSDIPRYTS